MRTVLDSLKGKLIVSCQALENEPLHSPFIMSRMALAAAQGGAAGIRANSVADISAIKEIVSLPMIGIIKRDYPGSEVFITATLREVDELMTVEPEIIALDATARPRPGGQTLEELVTQIRARYPSVLLMADIATVEEAVTAERLGFDCVGTTLYGYTAETARHVLAESDCGFLRAGPGSGQRSGCGGRERRYPGTCRTLPDIRRSYRGGWGGNHSSAADNDTLYRGDRLVKH